MVFYLTNTHNPKPLPNFENNKCREGGSCFFLFLSWKRVRGGGSSNDRKGKTRDNAKYSLIALVGCIRDIDHTPLPDIIWYPKKLLWYLGYTIFKKNLWFSHPRLYQGDLSILVIFVFIYTWGLNHHHPKKIYSCTFFSTDYIKLFYWINLAFQGISLLALVFLVKYYLPWGL